MKPTQEKLDQELEKKKKAIDQMTDEEKAYRLTMYFFKKNIDVFKRLKDK